MARRIDYIVLHCTATPQTTTVESISRYWRQQLGWRNPGYHRVFKTCGERVDLLSLEKIANGVKGYNQNAIHLSYIGGVDENGKPKDTRTDGQKAQMECEIRELLALYPDAEVKGHRDFPKVAKACPSFDVETWLKEIGL